eukprot:CAMPEP_0174313020 /NCGR_PEP_ID=MMETSP0810-20121108/4695_1 /TAXON_ID=73025 ORGANISM="Eutreptiella gymnastica-like, Strain CCMP1594" /NCGR_SAMPLE_ID=MMETSP0810 /ASSEMBLY_ACC=CAM_ASM_000659 /LENGTH=44 /DNA_ID= /DNA_START= /DNA_END= /DNA_ORIENTATION=
MEEILHIVTAWALSNLRLHSQKLVAACFGIVDSTVGVGCTATPS